MYMLWIIQCKKLLALRLRGTVKCQESCPAPSAVLCVKGTKQRKHRDWFDECNEEINELLNQKQLAFTTMLQNKSPEAKQRYQILRNRVQTVTWQLKNKWWKDRAMEIQGYGNSGDSRSLCNASLWQFMVPSLQVEFSSYHRMKIYWRDRVSTTAFY